ncbi:hypothetical protein PoB_005756700 [Plakobranchus ocellatus]|uniref:Uncharacterized protein n=1 Tax=Plakobranchus ocellatus TaxID=259542 RepID=A0AAV4CHI3_9GAST|nr:hypothetical protein PoB_005756700 [Plakobranchus ocellatus]
MPKYGSSSGRAVGYHPRGPWFKSKSGPCQIFIAPLCPPSTKWSNDNENNKNNNTEYYSDNNDNNCNDFNDDNNYSNKISE